MALSISVPAKINFWLEVVGKRADGYHDLSSLMLPVAVYDHVEVSVRSGEGISLACTAPGVPSDSRNLAWRAAELYLKSSGIACGVEIRLTKHIPVGAGMGGGSADAAAVLLALNRISGEPVSGEQLQAMAAKLGADVPFFLSQRPALATGVGEVLSGVDGIPDYPLLLIKPPISVATAHVYRSLKLTRGQSYIKLHTFLAHPWDLSKVLENDLESVTIEDHPIVGEIKEWLLARDAIGALMTGSGPTVFGVFSDKSKADSAALLGRKAWPECWVQSVRVLGSYQKDGQEG